MNVIAPEAFRTAMSEKELDQRGDHFAAAFPVSRIGPAEDIAGAAVFFLPRASEFITAHILPRDDLTPKPSSQYPAYSTAQA